MRKARWLVSAKDAASKPVLYHAISRVVDRRFVFAERECEAFRMFMRMYENFSGCRVLSYCVMSILSDRQINRISLAIRISHFK